MAARRQTAAAVRRESLAHAIAQGMSIEEAMLDVGYTASSAKSCRIKHGKKLVPVMDHPEVASRVAEIRAGAREQAAATTATVAAKLDEAYEVAKKKDMPGSMVSAAMAQAKLLGLVVDKVDMQVKPIGEMTEGELEMFLRRNGMEAELAAIRGDEPDGPVSEGSKRAARRAVGG